VLLFPSDPLNPRHADPHFVQEYVAARELDRATALLDHDLAAGGDAAGAVSKVPAGADAVYRGWMLRCEDYAAVAIALGARGTTLRTGPDQYRRAHELPGWYASLEEFTPASAWTEGPSRDEFDVVRTSMGSGPAVLRDYTKSMKHYWHEAMFIPEIADADAAWEVAARFLELRADSFVGGLVLRRFEAFTGAEVRTWWVNGHCALTTAHPDTPDGSPIEGPDTGPIRDAVAGLDLPFVTVDFAKRRDGVWRVVELGDGQVSDRPASTTASEFIAALF
jgi:ATP-grasp domain, R2K clade family 3